MTATAPRPSAVDTVATRLRPSRRPDVAAGLMLGVLLLDELIDLDPSHRRVIALALRDAATAIYPEPGEVLDEVLHNPAGEWVNEDELSCAVCDGEPNDRIVALGDQLDAAYARIDALTVELVTARRQGTGS